MLGRELCDKCVCYVKVCDLPLKHCQTLDYNCRYIDISTKMTGNNVSTFQYAVWCVSINTICTDCVCVCVVCSPFAQGRWIIFQQTFTVKEEVRSNCVSEYDFVYSALSTLMQIFIKQTCFSAFEPLSRFKSQFLPTPSKMQIFKNSCFCVSLCTCKIIYLIIYTSCMPTFAVPHSRAGSCWKGPICKGLWDV